MKRWTDTEYVDAYQRYMAVPGTIVSLDDHERALAEKDKEISALQERIAYYDRWLSNGVYYTNDEFLERVLKPRQRLMEKAVRFARILEQGLKKYEKEQGT